MKKAQTKAKGRVKFKNPPINELVIALYHLPIVDMRAQHIGLYWDKIWKRYPTCEQQAPVMLNVQFQIQHDITATTGELFIQSFLQYDFNQKIDVVNRCELTYINIIPPNDFWSTAAHLGKLFPPLASLTIPQEIGRMLVGVNSSFTYRFRDNLMVDSTLKLGKRLNTLEPVAMLEVRAHGAPEGLSIDATLAWLDIAHDATHEVFLNFTDKNLQKTIWKPV